MALALGSNINDPAPADRIAKAYTHLAAAQARAANGSPVEQALIAALARRYVEKPEGDQLPREAGVLGRDGRGCDALPRRSGCRHALRRKPDEPPPVASVRQGRQARARHRHSSWPPSSASWRIHPDHPGANHYYIHAVEASKTPGRAAAQAERLETLVPGAGHLVHMPAHIYIRTGQYQRSAKSNAAAARVDEQYFKKAGQRGDVPRDVLRPQPAVRVGGGDVRGALRPGPRRGEADRGADRPDRRRLAHAGALRAAGRVGGAAFRPLGRCAEGEGAGAHARPCRQRWRTTCAARRSPSRASSPRPTRRGSRSRRRPPTSRRT